MSEARLEEMVQLKSKILCVLTELIEINAVKKVKRRTAFSFLIYYQQTASHNYIEVVLKI